MEERNRIIQYMVAAAGNKSNKEFEIFCTEYSEHVNTSIADEGTECLDSSVHSSKTVTEGEESNADVTSHTSTNFDEGASISTASSSNKTTCLFCNCVRKTSGKKKQNLTFPQSGHVNQQIKQIARKLDDSEILSKLENQAVAYHQSCYAFYLTKDRRSTQEHKDSMSLASMTLGVSSGWPTPVLAKFHDNKTDVVISENEISWMVAMPQAGFIAGSFATRFISDYGGRRTTILSSSIPMVFGTILLLSSGQPWLICSARFLWGCGTGMIGTVVSMYLAEIADKDIRGRLSVGTSYMFNFGMLLAISVGPFLSYRGLNICLLVLPIAFFVACWWIPETPYYYLKKGKVEEARRVLYKLRNYKDQNEVEEELTLLKSSVGNDMHRHSSVKELLTSIQYRKAIIIATGLKFTQIMTGVVTVQNYLGRIMQDTQLDLSKVFIVFGVVRFFTGIMSSVLVDRVGRRKLLIYSYMGTSLCLIGTGTFFFCQEVLKIDQSLLAPYGYAAFAGILGCTVISTVGFTSINFVIFAEIFPMNVKAVALSALNIYGGVLGFIIGKGYQELKNWTGLCGVFWVFASVALLGAVFSFMCVPETKGKSLRDIQILLQGDLYDATDNRLNAVVSNDTELQELNKKENSP